MKNVLRGFRIAEISTAAILLGVPATTFSQTDRSADERAQGQGMKDLSADDSESRGRYAPDNTGLNERDRENRPTADQGGTSGSDVQLASRIRRSLVERDDLSTNAHNAKIIVNDGRVTLRGPVDSDREKQELEKLATAAAGSGNVTNELEVKQNQ